jgi:hypothetical protein
VINSEYKRHFSPLIIVFLVISIFWIIYHVSVFQIVYLFFGLLWGSFFLDLDHIIYWLYLNPNIEESRLAQIALRKYDFNSVIKLLESTHKDHTNLIFHHFFFQVVLILISAFVFTSTGNVFAMSFLFALNVHLLVDEYEDYRHDPTHLQNWLFARETKQLPVAYLGRYIGVFTALTLILSFLLLKSKI